MKKIFGLLVVVMSLSVNAEQIPTVNTGENISASKINSIVSKVNQSSFELGDVKTSILTEAKFQTIHGNCWVLMDGRSIAGKDLAVLAEISNIPDARGLALRAKNNGRSDGKQNPDGEIALGTYQADMYGTHTHIQNAHGHRALGNSTNGGSAVVLGGAAAFAGTTNTPNQAYYNNGSLSGNFFIEPSTAINQNAGGNETRMKNLSVNYFIKIHSTCQ